MKAKAYYPVNLDLNLRTCLVVGGGEIAEQKIHSLLSFGAKVIVVSPELNASLAKLAAAGKFSYIKGTYQQKFLKDAFLVIAATNDIIVNTKVARDAERRRMLVNVVDVPQLCNFIVPAVVRRGPMVVSISTGGASPMYAAQQRRKCEQCVTEAQGKFVEMLGKSRNEVQQRFKTMAERKVIYQQLIDAPIEKLIDQGKSNEAKRLFSDIIK